MFATGCDGSSNPCAAKRLFPGRLQSWKFAVEWSKRAERIGATEGSLAKLGNSRDASLRERARRVVPGGMWGHQNAANLPEGYPQFFARGEGCRVWDVDGNE